MARRDWVALVAVHSDAWLLSVAFYYGARLDGDGRAKLFKTINAGPTLFEARHGCIMSWAATRACGAVRLAVSSRIRNAPCGERSGNAHFCCSCGNSHERVGVQQVVMERAGHTSAASAAAGNGVEAAAQPAAGGSQQRNRQAAVKP